MPRQSKVVRGRRRALGKRRSSEVQQDLITGQKADDVASSADNGLKALEKAASGMDLDESDKAACPEEPTAGSSSAEPGSSSSPLFFRNSEGKLECHNRAYDMFHILNTEFPCMSLDIVLDNLGFSRVKYPLTCFLVVGTQAEQPKDCSVILKKASALHRTRFDEDDSEEESDNEDDDEEGEASDDDVQGGDEEGKKLEKALGLDRKDAVVQSRRIPHRGPVNRLRSMRQQPGVLAVWAEDGYFSVYDARDLLRELTDAQGSSSETVPKGKGRKPVFQSGKSDHPTEGYAVEWSPRVTGRLATGDRHGKLFVWEPREQAGSFAGTQLKGHQKSVEFVQWSPTQDNVLASCSVDTTIRLWDVRDRSPQKMQWVADSTDINVISWNANANSKHLLASGADSGVFKIWDLRSVKAGEAGPVAQFPFHQESVVSLEWSPVNDSLLAVGSDSMVTFWDLSVEADEPMEAEGGKEGAEKLPPQLMFIHQGLEELKELRWHPQIPGLCITTDYNGLNFFKPSNWKTLIMQ